MGFLKKERTFDTVCLRIYSIRVPLICNANDATYIRQSLEESDFLDNTCNEMSNIMTHIGCTRKSRRRLRKGVVLVYDEISK